MKSLFLRMFLWFCAATAVLLAIIVMGYVVTNPDQVPFAWPRVGRGAVVSAGHVAVASWERGGRAELARYLGSLARDTGLEGNLFDSSGRELSGRDPVTEIPPNLFGSADGELLLRVRGHEAGIRLQGGSGAAYLFVATVPARTGGGFWYRAFIILFTLMGALLCYLLAHHVTAPIVHLRNLTSRFARGDLTARVTSRKILDRKDEIGGLAGDFNQMASRIETLLKSQRRLVADVSHELRSPLTRISLALGLMRRRGSDSHTSLARMEREVERLNTLISQLLTLSRLESLDQAPPMESVDLGALVREVAADADFEATGVNRSVRLLESDGCSVRGARDLLRSAVENVVRNAVKYTVPESQVSIRLLRSGSNGNATATIVVADDGPGVPPEALEHMFEPFYRVDEARDRRSGGAGLGLAITRNILTLHGGSVSAVNRDKGGLEMRMTLPIAADS